MKLVLIILLTAFALNVQAAYPEKNIHVIIHVPSGGGTDNMARLVLRYAGKKLNTHFIIENHKGAGGQVGYTALSMAPADGYTIGSITTTSIVTHELTRRNVAFRFKESFIPLAQVTMDPSGVYVREESHIKSFREFLAYAKTHPGKLNCASTSLWGAHHIHCKLLERKCGVQLNNIPFDGSSEVRNNLMGGHVDVALGGISEFRSLIEAGKVRPIVVASRERISGLPNLPTYQELGYDLITGSHRGFAVPTGTPKKCIDVLDAAIEEVMKDSAFLKDADRLGIGFTLDYKNSGEFTNLLYALSDTMKALIRREKK